MIQGRLYRSSTLQGNSAKSSGAQKREESQKTRLNIRLYLLLLLLVLLTSRLLIGFYALRRKFGRTLLYTHAQRDLFSSFS